MGGRAGAHWGSCVCERESSRSSMSRNWSSWQEEEWSRRNGREEEAEEGDR